MSLSIETLEHCAVGDEIAKNTWSDMTEYANGFSSLDTFLSELSEVENEFREKYFSETPEAKTKSGKWKTTYVDKHGEKKYILPNAWITARSVVSKAMEAGIAFHDRSQTVVANEAREVIARRNPKTLSEQVLSKYDAAYKTWITACENMTSAEKNELMERIKKRVPIGVILGS